jgi:protein O-mannosyl-transferase
MPKLIQKLLRHPLLVLVLFCATALAVYSPALAGTAIWDDDYLVGENPFFRSPVFAGEVFRHFLFFESNSTYYRPVQNLSYMADYWLWGGMTGFHVTNILLHAVSGWLVWRLLRRLLSGMAGEKADVLALAVSAVWLVHPIHNAAVAYVSGRADSLAAVFCAAAWIVWLRARDFTQGRKIAGAVAACALLLLGLCSKEIALMWTVLFFLHTVFFEKARLRTVATLLVAVGTVVGVYAVLRALPEARTGSAATAEPFAARSLLALRALADYAGLIFFPKTLLMERSLTRGRSEYLPLLGGVTLFVIAWLLSKRSQDRSLRRFGAAWFFVAFIPISNLIPLNADVAEHWIYLASIGFMVFVGGLVLRFRYAPAIVAVAICALATRTWFRAQDWVEPERFAQKTIACGGVTPRLLSYYASHLGRRKAFAEQEDILRKMLVVFPDSTTARINLGICMLNQGRKDEAEKLLAVPKDDENAVSATPRSWSAALNLAGMRLKDGRAEEALALALEWRVRFPKTWELAAMESMALENLGRTAEAAAPVAEFCREQWWHRTAQMQDAALKLKAGLLDEAVASLERAARLDVRDPVPHMEIARIEAGRNQPGKAADAVNESIARAPDSAEPRLLLAGILGQFHQTKEAAAAMEEARRLKPRENP